VAETGESAIPAGNAAARPIVGAALVLGAASLWATFGIFAKYLYAAGYTPLELASVRAAVAFVGVALIALRALRTRRVAQLLPARRALLFFAAYGVLGFALFELIFLLALERTDISIGVALLYTAPAFVVILSALIWRERIGALRVIALIMVLLGVILVTGTAGALARGTATLPLPALLLGLAAGFGYALYTLFSKVSTGRYGTGASLFWSFFFAMIALGVVAPPFEPLLRSPEHIPVLIALGIVPTILPYALFLAALKLMRASSAAMLASIEPVVAALLAALFLGERLDALQAVGIALVVAAAIIVARSGESETTPVRDP
jgi:drug/metabolite transporter (DMT)-like permease